LALELELELILTRMAQKPTLRAEVYARALRASRNVKRAEVWVSALSAQRRKRRFSSLSPGMLLALYTHKPRDVPRCGALSSLQKPLHYRGV
jgi:hypothetical protein